MTTMNEERVAFEAWLGITPKGAAHDLGYEAFKAGAAWQRAQGAAVQWVPVSERLPQIKQVLSEKCTLDGREIPPLYRSGPVLTFDGRHVSAGIVEWFHAKSPLSNVTHWMPLPAAPDLAASTEQEVCDWPTCECALDLDKCKVQSVEPAPAQDEREAFERETRYIVIKRSDLAKLDQAGLLRPESLDGLVDICGRLPPREYVVVESDWPEFQPTWAAIEARVSGLATTVPAGSKVVPVELLERLEHVTRTLVPHLQCHVDLRALLASAGQEVG